MNWLLAFLRNYLLPGVDDEPGDDAPPPDDDTPPDPEDDTPPDPEDDTPPQEDDTPPDPEDDPAPRESRAQKTIRETRERAQNAERDLAAARRDLEAARRPQSAQPAPPDPEQVLWQQEEETLRNPEANDWQRYAINANRAARNAQRQSHQALQRAEDLADRSAFQAIAAVKPKTFERYKDAVEAKVQELRAAGRQPPPREAILQLMLGKDMLDGKLRSSEKPKKPNTPAAPRRTASSDVPATGRARLSEAEARAKRLENVRI